jgi:hypothetical protein
MKYNTNSLNFLETNWVPTQKKSLMSTYFKFTYRKQKLVINRKFERIIHIVKINIIKFVRNAKTIGMHFQHLLQYNQLLYLTIKNIYRTTNF